MPAPVHGTERGVEMDYSTIRDDGALMNLAAKVVDPDRRNTLVVLSADRYGRPGFDPADIGDALAGTDVDVYWLPDPPAANRLDGLTDGVACMYNGAAAILHAGQGAIIVLDKGPTSPDYLIGRAMAHATFMRRPDPKPAPAANAGDRPDGRRLRAENKRLKGELKRLRAASSADVEDLYPLFDDPDDWLDLEIRLAWARLIPAEGKRANRLPARWTMTPGFAATIASSPRRGEDGGGVRAHPPRTGRPPPVPQRAERNAEHDRRLGQSGVADRRPAGHARLVAHPLDARRRRERRVFGRRRA